MARERIVKYPPKRGKLTKRQVQQAVEKVVFGKRGGGEAGRKHGETTIKVGRDAKTGRFISCQEAERRKDTAVVVTIKRSNKRR